MNVYDMILNGLGFNESIKNLNGWIKTLVLTGVTKKRKKRGL